MCENSQTPTSSGPSTKSDSAISRCAPRGNSDTLIKFPSCSTISSLCVVISIRTPDRTKRAISQQNFTCISGCKCDSGSSIINRSPRRTTNLKYRMTGKSSETIEENLERGMPPCDPSGRKENKGYVSLVSTITEPLRILFSIILPRSPSGMCCPLAFGSSAISFCKKSVRIPDRGGTLMSVRSPAVEALPIREPTSTL